MPLCHCVRSFVCLHLTRHTSCSFSCASRRQQTLATCWNVQLGTTHNVVTQSMPQVDAAEEAPAAATPAPPAQPAAAPPAQPAAAQPAAAAPAAADADMEDDDMDEDLRAALQMSLLEQQPGEAAPAAALQPSTATATPAPTASGPTATPAAPAKPSAPAQAPGSSAANTQLPTVWPCWACSHLPAANKLTLQSCIARPEDRLLTIRKCRDRPSSSSWSQFLGSCQEWTPRARPSSRPSETCSNSSSLHQMLTPSPRRRRSEQAMCSHGVACPAW